MFWLIVLIILIPNYSQYDEGYYWCGKSGW